MKRLALLFTASIALTACTPRYVNPDLPRPIKGGENAVVVVEEFADFQCPACGQAYGTVKMLVDKFGDEVQWKFYHFPLTTIHPYAFNAAMAAECAHDQGKFWEMHDMMFENQTDLSRGKLNDYAAQVGLDMELYDACFKSRAKSDIVRADIAAGEKRSVNSTPTFFVNNQRVPNWSQLESVISSLLQPAVPTVDAGSDGQ